MPKIKVEAKKTIKLDVEPADLAKAISESWTGAEIADLLTDIMEQVQYIDNKEHDVITYITRYGYKDTLIAWSQGKKA